MADHERFRRSALVQAAINDRDFGMVVRLARDHLGLRQADLAARAGMSRSTVSRVETGRYHGLDVVRFRAVADAVGMPPPIFAALLGVADAVPATVVPRDRHPGARFGQEEDPLRRRTFIAVAGAVVPVASLAWVDDALAVPADPGRVFSVEELGARLTAAGARYDAGRLTEFIDGSPELLGAAQQTADTATRIDWE